MAARGIDYEVIAAGQFNPRGHVGGLFAGGLAGDEAGTAVGGLAEGVGTAAASVAGMRAVDAASGLPAHMLVCVLAGVQEAASSGQVREVEVHHALLASNS